MLKTLLAAFFLGVLSPMLAHASDIAPAADVNSGTAAEVGWKSFDDLVAGATSSMMVNPKVALQKAQIAAAFAQGQTGSSRQSEALATSFWLEAEALTRINRADDARVALDRAIKIAASDHRTTVLDGNIALSLARVADSKSDVALALSSLHKAHDIFLSVGDARGQAMALQGLGNIYDEAHDFSHEIEYYRRASKIYSGDPALELSAANNVGFALLQLGRYGEAIRYFRRALALGFSLRSAFLEARVLTNLASTYTKLERYEDAELAADQALRLLGRNDENGWAPSVWGAKAEIAFERDALDEASADIERAFRGVDLTATGSSFRDIHEIAYKVYRAKGELTLALQHFEAFKRLDDRSRSLSASANLALTGGQFDFTTQRYEIEHLQSEQLKRDISLRESRAATQRIIFSGLLFLAVLLIVWVSLRNISVRKHRNEITKANVSLRQTLAERDTEIQRRVHTETALRSAKEVAERANRVKAQFLANMSHELRTPLNAIMGFSEVISLEALGPVGTPTYKTYASDILASGRHLLSVLNDILDMARIDAGKTTLSESEVLLADVIKNALRAFGKEVRGPRKTIRVTAFDPTIRVRADARMLSQILINLVSNAVKFTGDDGLIEVGVVRNAAGIDLVVRDNGLGIPEDKMGLVMQPFGQAHDAFARSHGGVGLGLSVVKSLVELHGGRLTLASKPNKGTEARVHLPLERILPPASETSRPLAS